MWRLAYRIFHAVSGVQYWLERHFTRAGWFVLGGAIAAGVLSFKNTYTLRLSDGFSALTEVLQRIEMKIKNPALWV